MPVGSFAATSQASGTQAAQALVSAEAFLAGLGGVVAADVPSVSFSPDVYANFRAGTELINSILQTSPSWWGGDMDMPLPPDDITGLIAIDPNSINNIIVPTFTGVKPTLTIPAAPTNLAPTFTAVEPVLNPVTTPAKPTITLPAAPTIDVSSINIPDPINLDIPYRDFGELIDENLIVPTNTFDWAETEYQSALLDENKAQLLNALQNGQYIDPTLWENTWNRARENRLKTLIQERDDIRRAHASRGFDLPPGAMNIMDQEAVQKAQNDIIDVERDLTNKEIQLHNENWKFSVQQATALEDILIKAHLSMMERSLNAQKIALEMSVTVYEANIKKMEVRRQNYIARAEAYKTEIQAAAIRADAWKSLIEGAKVQTEIQGLYVDLYKAQIDGVSALTEVYKTDMEAAKIQSDVEKAKMEIFAVQVDAFSKRVAAYSAQFDAFKAQISGELAKAQMFGAEVDAFQAEVGASKASVEIETLKLEAQVKSNQSVLDEYEARIKGYEAKLEAISEQYKAYASRYSVDGSVVGSRMNALSNAYDMERKAWADYGQQSVESAKIGLGVAEANLKVYTDVLNARASAGAAGAEVYKGITVAALGAVNALASSVEYDAGAGTAGLA